MFKNLFALKEKKTFIQALLLYGISSAILYIVSMILIIGLTITTNFEEGIILKISYAIIAAIIYYFSFIILKTKNLSSIKHSFFTILPLVLTFNIGFLIGLIPLAYFTTTEIKSETKNN